MPQDLLRWTRYATYAYLVAVPGLVESLNLLGMHDTARALQAMLCCLAVAAWAQNSDLSLQRLSTAQIAGGGLVILLTLISIGQAQWPLFAATEACLWLGLIALVWVFSNSPRDACLQEIPAVMTLAILIMGLQEIMNIGFSWLSSYPLEVEDVGRGHPNRRHFNHVQTMALIMGAMMIWYSTARWMRWAAWSGVAMGLALVWLTGARSTLLAVSVVGLGSLIFTEKSRHLWVKRVLMILFWSTLIYQVFYKFIPNHLEIILLDNETMGERNQIGTVNTRIMLWRHAWEMAAQHPWAGWGGLHYASQWRLPAAHPHNIVLQWAAEWGWVSTLLMLYALGRWTRPLWLAMWQGLHGISWPYSPLVTAAWTASLAGWIDALFSGTLTMPVSQVWWCTCLGLAMSTADSISPHFAPVYHRRNSIIVGIWMMMFAVLITNSYIITQDIPHLTSKPLFYFKPRLWRMGELVGI